MDEYVSGILSGNRTILSRAITLTDGLYITGEGRKLAVLAVDPSSKHSKGSILGDRTRMQKLGAHPGAFIRPSPAAGRN